MAALEALFQQHALDASAAPYARLGIADPERAVAFERLRGTALLRRDDVAVASVVEADRLLGLALGTPKVDTSAALGHATGELAWLSLDASLAPARRAAVLDELLEQCQKWPFAMLTALVDFDQAAEVLALQQRGAQIFGANLTWVGRVRKISDRLLQHPMVERASLSFDEAALLRCVEAAYESYRSHYHADPRISVQTASTPYVNLVREHVRDGGLVAVVEHDGKIDGFSTINPHPINAFLDERRVGEVEMSGTSPAASTPGAYEITLRRCLAWFKEQGFRFVLFGCKADNFAVQSVWARLGGMAPRRCRYRLHWWLEQ